YYTKYCGSYSAGTTLYIYIDAGKKVTLSGYRLTTANDTQKYPGRNPASWSLLGSNVKSKVPGSDVWTLLDRRENDNTLGAVNYTPYDFFFTYPTPVIPGDVNGDGLTSLLDYEAMRAYIVGKQVEGFSAEAADINADGKVNAQDLMRLIHILTEE
ncbi:MAG: dockerin type I domain-containing protein, partial [Bacteroidaceae bacterium]|nr:dockerin type I domain-containing protein [Bacteroidaceae bacterium]